MLMITSLIIALIFEINVMGICNKFSQVIA